MLRYHRIEGASIVAYTKDRFGDVLRYLQAVLLRGASTLAVLGFARLCGPLGTLLPDVCYRAVLVRTVALHATKFVKLLACLRLTRVFTRVVQAHPMRPNKSTSVLFSLYTN